MSNVIKIVDHAFADDPRTWGLYQFAPPSIDPMACDVSGQVRAAAQYLHHRYGEPGGVSVDSAVARPGPTLTIGKYGSTFIAEMVDGELVWTRRPPPSAAEQAARIAGWYTAPTIFDDYAAWQSRPRPPAPWWARVLAWVILLRVLLERVRG